MVVIVIECDNLGAFKIVDTPVVAFELDVYMVVSDGCFYFLGAAGSELSVVLAVEYVPDTVGEVIRKGKIAVRHYEPPLPDFFMSQS